MGNKKFSQLIAILASLALNGAVVFALLFLVQKKERLPPTVVQTSVVFRSILQPDFEPDDTPIAQALGKAAANANSPAEKAVPAPKARNGLLRHDQGAELTTGSNSGKGEDIFAAVGQPKTDKPNFANSDRHETHAWKAEVNRDGSVKLSDKFVIGVPDLTDVIMKLRGDTLYDPEKREYLKETKEMRQVQSHEYTKANLERALNELSSRLEKIWQNRELSADKKKQRFFDMWDECAEEGSDQVLMMSQMVRLSVQTFVSRNLPKGSESGYSDEELRRLNQGRSSKAEFNPYS